MRIEKQKTPGAVEVAIGEIVPQIVEYLELEESQTFSAADLRFSGYFTADSKEGFVVFEYMSDQGPRVAFVQHVLGRERVEDGAIACWEHVAGQAIEATLLDYLEMNPLE